MGRSPRHPGAPGGGPAQARRVARGPPGARPAQRGRRPAADPRPRAAARPAPPEQAARHRLGRARRHRRRAQHQSLAAGSAPARDGRDGADRRTDGRAVPAPDPGRARLRVQVPAAAPGGAEHDVRPGCPGSAGRQAAGGVRRPPVAGPGHRGDDRAGQAAAPARRHGRADRPGRRPGARAARARAGGRPDPLARLRAQRPGHADGGRRAGRPVPAARRAELPALPAHQGGGVHGPRRARDHHAAAGRRRARPPSRMRIRGAIP